MLRREPLDLRERSFDVVAVDERADAVGAVLRCAASSSSAIAREPPRPSTTATSDGPAGRSIATSRDTISFASFTNALPGPTILSTRGIVSVPYASAAIACAPPTAHTSSTPSAPAAAATRPAPSGGVTTTIRSTPATCAGTAHITSVETRRRGT